MLTVYFTNFTKRRNSTAAPNYNEDGAYFVGYSAHMKDNTGIVNPIITIDIKSNENLLPSNVSSATALFAKTPGANNYAVIADFGRFYYVKSWTHVNGLWEVALESDPMASFRNTILHSAQTIVRADSEPSQLVADSFYRTMPRPDDVIVDAKTKFLDYPYGDSNVYQYGTYIVATVGSCPDADLNDYAPPVTYYAMKGDSLKKLVRHIYGSTDWLDFSLADFGEDVVKSIVDPCQYIKSVMWLPLTIPDAGNILTNVGNINLGWWSLSCSELGIVASVINEPLFTTSIIFDYTKLKHPQAKSSYSYLMESPYSKYTLHVPGFGSVELDSGRMSTLISELYDITFMVKIDLITGRAALMLTHHNTTVANPVYYGQLGVNVPIGGTKIDALGAITTAVGAITTFATGNIAGGIDGLVNSAGSLTPTVSTSGEQGSYLVASIKPFISAQFYRIATFDGEYPRGFACARYDAVENYPGFCQVLNPTFPPVYGYDSNAAIGAATGAAPTAAEMDTIRNFMSEGFYVE